MEQLQLDKLSVMSKHTRKQLRTLIIPSVLRLVMLGLFLSCPHWVPILYSSVKLICSNFYGPKCLFIFSNLIIIFLVGESKLSRASSKPDIYDEYVSRRQGLHKAANVEVQDIKKVAPEESLIEDCKAQDDDDVDVKLDEVSEEFNECVMNEECEEEKGLPADELNRRVEDFIARVNMQRRLEARMLMICSK